MDSELAGFRHLAPAHDRLEQLIDLLAVAVQAQSADAIRSARAAFDHDLMAHFEAEERVFIPTLASLSERDARIIVLEHRHLTRRWSEICASLDRGSASVAMIRAYADELRAHARHEDAVLYRLANDERVV